jgi:hypothetical protein
VFIVHVSCSDEACAEEIEAVVESLDELDGLVCECGYGTVLVSVAEVEHQAPVIQLRPRRDPRPLAA